MKKFYMIIAAIIILFSSCSKNKYLETETVATDTFAQEEKMPLQNETTAKTEESYENMNAIVLPELSVSLDERTNTCKFSYKKSVLNISKAKFNEYNLTNENIQKFFDEMEKVYVLYSDFFMVHNLPDIFTYNTVTQEYADTTVGSNAWAQLSENATYYEENMFAGYLSRIDTGFPSIVGHEVGHLYTAWGNGSNYNASKYVWDSEFFADVAKYYLISLPDMDLIDVTGEICLMYSETYKQMAEMAEMPGYAELIKTIPSLSMTAYPKYMYLKIFTIAEKYGYNTLHEVLEEMMTTEIEYNIKSYFDLFCDIYAERTGEHLKDGWFTQEELDEIYREIYVHQ